MKSGELALEPAPLSVSSQKLPSAMRLMPEWPCTGWPSKGRLMPVGRPADKPITEPSFSTRWAVVNLPAWRRSAGASAGAGITVSAGITAWPVSVAGKACCAWAGANAAQTRAAPAARWFKENMVGYLKKKGNDAHRE